MLEIHEAYGDIAAVRKLFDEYAAMLGVDLGFQGYDEERASLPGKYAPPDGRLFIARRDGGAAGCVGLRRHADGVCEMKRLYVKPEFRGLKIGYSLVAAAINAAREIGYERMILDTLPTLASSLKLYRRLGFTAIAPYYDNPHPDAVYLQLDLA